MALPNTRISGPRKKKTIRLSGASWGGGSEGGKVKGGLCSRGAREERVSQNFGNGVKRKSRGKNSGGQKKERRQNGESTDSSEGGTSTP